MYEYIGEKCLNCDYYKYFSDHCDFCNGFHSKKFGIDKRPEEKRSQIAVLKHLKNLNE